MKFFSILTTLFVVSSSLYGQDSYLRGEFATNPNGLMYPDSSMRLLRNMVDSLNLRYKTCDLNKVFKSQPQGRVWEIEFEVSPSQVNEITKMMDTGTEPYTLLRMYSKELKAIDSNKLLVQYYSAEQKYSYLIGDPYEGYDNDRVLFDRKVLNSHSWYYKLDDSFSKRDRVRTLYCRYIPNQLSTIRIPVNYGALIQYVDCMIDTVYTNPFAKYRSERNSRSLRSITNLNKYIHSKNASKKNSDEFEIVSDSDMEFALRHLSKDSTFIQLLDNVIKECIEHNHSSDNLEALAEQFFSKKALLDLKRSRVVTGFCSQDQRPRLHALSVAMLAAEVQDWSVFLRSHLDIMNDRFIRLSDGSYAYASRKTYLKELEELNINVIDLILGMTLRASNTADQHYYGNIWRIGRAMAESKDKGIFEQEITAAMKDEELDEFNRGLMFLLFRGYLYSLENLLYRNEQIKQMQQHVTEYPSFIQSAIMNLKPADLKNLVKEN